MIWFYIFIIVAAVTVGYLYWDKCRELKIVTGEAEPNLPTGTIFFYNVDRGALLQEAESMIEPLIERGFRLIKSIEHEWGYEQHYVFISSDHRGKAISWVNWVIDVRGDHPTFAAKVACFDCSLTVAQTIDELQRLPAGVNIYAKEEIKDDED